MKAPCYNAHMVPCPWSAYEPGTISFCEERLCAWVVEPSNAWSNIGYVIAGILVLLGARRRIPFFVIGISTIFIGFGSFAFHGTGTRIGEVLDLAAMYCLAGIGLVFAFRRFVPMSTTTFVLTYLGIVAASVALMVGLHTNGIFMFAAQFASVILLEVYLYATGRRAPDYRWQWGLVASFGLAFFIWNLDKWKVLCDPRNHFVTGHAVWHVLAAITIYCYFRFQDKIVT